MAGTKEYLESLLAGGGSDYQRRMRVEQWLRDEPHITCTHAEFSDLINTFIDEGEYEEKAQDISALEHAWFAKFELSLDATIRDFIPSIPLGDHVARNYISDWLDRHLSDCDWDAVVNKILPNMGVETQQAIFLEEWAKKTNFKMTESFLLNILPQSLNETVRYTFICHWLCQAETQCDATYLMEKIIPLLNININRTRVMIAWLKNNHSKCDWDTLGKLISVLEDENKIGVIQTWVGIPGNQCDLQAMVTKVFGFVKNPEMRGRLFREWLQKNQCDIKVLQSTIFPLIAGDNLKRELLLLSLNQMTDPEAKFREFVRLAQESQFGTMYHYENMIHYFAQIWPHDSVDYLRRGLFLCKTLYSNHEFLQADFFVAFVGRLQLALNTDTASRAVIIEFARSLQDDDCCLNVLESVMGHGLTPVEFLLIARDRLSSNFTSLNELLAIPLLGQGGALVEGAWENLKSQFGDDLPKDLNLNALFSYYDIMQRQDQSGQINYWNEFRRLVKPEILEKIGRDFVPPATIPYILRVEYNKFLILNVGDLPEMALLCRYLKRKVPESLPSIEQSIAKINEEIVASGNSDNASSSSSSSSNRKEETPEVSYKKMFKTLLENQSATQEDVIQFFRTVSGIPLTNSTDQEKLYSLFNAKKQALAYLFSQPDGIKNYVQLLYGIGDGCAANIGTKTNMYIYRMLLNDPEDRVLYPVFSDKIAEPILSGGTADRLGGSVEGVDIFSSRYIIESYISPQGLLASLAQEFYFEGKKQLNAAELIQGVRDKDKNGYVGGLLGAKESALFYDNLMDVYDTKANREDKRVDELTSQKEAEMAAYLIIRKTVPEVLESPYCQKMNEEFRAWLSDSPPVQDILPNIKRLKMED